jgi:hypothetical protein
VLVTIFLGADPLSAQNLSSEYTGRFGLSLRFWQPPCLLESVNGDTYEITGAGTFSAQTNSVSAAGTSAHKIPNGTVETGVWTSNQLISFDMALRRMRFGNEAWLHEFQASTPNPLPLSFSPIPIGGLAVFRIRLLPASEMPMSAVLQVNCALADAPRDRSADGIRLKSSRATSGVARDHCLRGSVTARRFDLGRAQRSSIMFCLTTVEGDATDGWSMG